MLQLNKPLDQLTPINVAVHVAEGIVLVEFRQPPRMVLNPVFLHGV